MSFTEKRLCNPTQLTTSGQTLYTVPASKTSIIKQIVVTNVTGSAATFSLYIGSAATPNALFNATSVAANDTVIINLSQVLNQLETLTALASTNSALNITISGVENDGPLNPLSTYIADQAITTAKLADASVTTAKIAVGAVVNEDIANNAVTQSKLASNLSGVTVTTSSLLSTIISSPFEGQLAFLTDTNQVLVYNGAAWVMIADTDTPPALQLIGSSDFNATQAVVFDGFTSEFNNYQVKLRIDNVSADCDLFLRYRNSSGNDGASSYFSAIFGLGDGGGASNVTQLSANYQFIGGLDFGANTNPQGHRSATIDIYSPLNAVRTEMTYSSWGYTQAGTGTYYTGGGAFNTTTIHQGFVFFTSNGTATMSGSFQVYGYRK